MSVAKAWFWAPQYMFLGLSIDSWSKKIYVRFFIFLNKFEKKLKGKVPFGSFLENSRLSICLIVTIRNMGCWDQKLSLKKFLYMHYLHIIPQTAWRSFSICHSPACKTSISLYHYTLVRCNNIVACVVNVMNTSLNTFLSFVVFFCYNNTNSQNINTA